MINWPTNFKLSPDGLAHPTAFPVPLGNNSNFVFLFIYYLLVFKIGKIN